MNTLLNPASAPQPVPPAVGIAKRLLAMPRQVFGMWDEGIKLIWRNPSAGPQQVFDALGTDSVHLVTASASLASALEAESPGCTAATLTLVKPFTVNLDGTVTVTV